jgi:hypothetical protein
MEKLLRILVFFCILIMYFIVVYFLLIVYVKCSFVSLSILIVMYVPFCVFCLIVLFCVLFACKHVLDYGISGHFSATPTGVFTFFFLICKANTRV